MKLKRNKQNIIYDQLLKDEIFDIDYLESEYLLNSIDSIDFLIRTQEEVL